MLSAVEAIERLREGNRRYVSGVRGIQSLPSAARRAELTEGQSPFAVVLSCSDSRVPVEAVFDQGLGDLFVIRVAGNVAAPSQIGSVEFAVQHFGTPLVVVLGHSRCGAVKATLEIIRDDGAELPRNLQSIIDLVRPPLEELLETGASGGAETLIKDAVRANVCSAAKRLHQESGVLGPLVARGEVVVAGAEYDLHSGEVDFFHGLPRGG